MMPKIDSLTVSASDWAVNYCNASRWVLKVNDPKTISEIDAIFVIVEPDGGSAKPGGKP
jgi:hypothetical protein